MKIKIPWLKTVFDTGGVNNNLSRICWMFPEWVAAYNRFGAVPGVSIDLKAKESKYNLRLMQISGSKNAGRVVNYAMGFVESEIEEALI